MKFKFIGDCKEMKVFGYDFSNGATPDVTDEKAIAKLQGNAEFEVVEDTSPAAPAAPAAPAKDKAAKAEPKQDAAKPTAEVDGNLPGVN